MRPEWRGTGMALPDTSFSASHLGSGSGVNHQQSQDPEASLLHSQWPALLIL